MLDAKEVISRFDQLVEEKSQAKAQEMIKEVTRMKKMLKKKDHELKDKIKENKHLKSQMDEQNEYVKRLEARIEELTTDKEEVKVWTPDDKKRIYNEIEMIDKNPLDDDEEVVVTTHNTSNKKKPDMREEIEYPTGDFFKNMQTPPTKKYRSRANKVAWSVGKFEAPKHNTLRSSLPVCLRETSYFDNEDQKRTLLGEKKGGTYEKTLENKMKEEEDPSFGDGDVNVETDYDFD